LKNAKKNKKSARLISASEIKNNYDIAQLADEMESLKKMMTECA